MLGLDELASVLAGLEARKENGAASSFCISFEHSFILRKSICLVGEIEQCLVVLRWLLRASALPDVARLLDRKLEDPANSLTSLPPPSTLHHR
jgi:hypothetical protein